MTSSSALDVRPLVGSWRLLSFVLTFTDTGERHEPFGPNPDGRMVFDAGGRIVFLITAADRRPPTNDADRAALFNSMAAYSGLVRLDGPGRIITTVDLASNPLWGNEQVRFFALDGNRLTLKTPEQPMPRYPGRLVIGELIWQRENLVQ